MSGDHQLTSPPNCTSPPLPVSSITCRDLYAARRPPPAARRPLPAARCPPPAARRPLPAARCPPPAAAPRRARRRDARGLARWLERRRRRWRRQDRNRCEMAAARPGKIATAVRPVHSRHCSANRQLTPVAILGRGGTITSHLSRSLSRPPPAARCPPPAARRPGGPAARWPGGPVARWLERRRWRWRRQDRNRCEVAAARPDKIATSVRPLHSRHCSANRQLTPVAILGRGGTITSHLSRSLRRRAAARRAARRRRAGGARAWPGRLERRRAALDVAKIATGVRWRLPVRTRSRHP